MPNPRPTTAACRRYFDIWRDSPGYGWLAMARKNSPARSASGGEAQGVRQKTRPSTKRIFDLMYEGSAGAKRFLFYSRITGASAAVSGGKLNGPNAKER